VIVDPRDLPEILPVTTEDSSLPVGAIFIPPGTMPPGTSVYVYPGTPVEDSTVEGLSYSVNILAFDSTGEPIHDFSEYGNVEICFEVSTEHKVKLIHKIYYQKSYINCEQLVE
jgi:hypothetical protein